MDRRSFLRVGLGTGMAVAGAGLLTACEKLSADYGPLQDPDVNGLFLPPGFTGRVVAVTGQAVGGTGFVWPANPDGGACFPVIGGGWVYVSNNETAWPGGGASRIEFDATGSIVAAGAILTRTDRNCAGGPTPWNTWLSCEEVSRGVVWETDPYGVDIAAARPAMGRFTHEAAAVHAPTGDVYMTEDRPDGGFYRFSPTVRGALGSGALQVLTEVGGTLAWTDVPDPAATTTSTRYQVPGTKVFNGGEGLWCEDDRVVFATKGDNRLWSYRPALHLLEVLYDDDTSATPVLTGLDNVTLPGGNGASHVFVAEDGADMEIVAVDLETEGMPATPFCRLAGRAGSEITGPAFTPAGDRLYFSSQRNPGETFEITGPFRQHQAR